MQCRKCKAELSDGETFCRKCATSIYVDDDIYFNNPSNNTKLHKIKAISFRTSTKENEISQNQVISNKDLVNRNQNDVEYAQKSLIKSLLTIFLLLSLLIIIIIFIIIKL